MDKTIPIDWACPFLTDIGLFDSKEVAQLANLAIHVSRRKYGNPYAVWIGHINKNFQEFTVQGRTEWIVQRNPFRSAI